MKFYEMFTIMGELPQPYGSFHLCWFIGVFVVGFALSFLLRKRSDKTLRIVIGVLWFIMFSLEIIKLIGNNSHMENGQVIGNFDPSTLSFQFCSLPIYFLPVVAFARKGKTRDIFAFFLGTYGFIAGLVTYVFPSTIFSDAVFFNYHTFIHHGIQIITGLILLIRYFDKMSVKDLFRTFVLFFITVIGARLLNELMHGYYPNNLNVDYFYLSPYTEREFPVVGNIKQIAPYPAFVLGYIVSFTFLSGACYGVTKGIQCIINAIKSRKGA